MSDKKDYSTPETIFSVPADITEMEKQDAINHILERVKGTLVILTQVMETDREIPIPSTTHCLFGIYGQLEMVEKLVNTRGVIKR